MSVTIFIKNIAIISRSLISQLAVFMFCISHITNTFRRPILMQYGLWDQLRVDHGKEWTLMLFAQEQLAHMRRNQSRSPHVQTTSKLVTNYIHS